MAAGPRLLLLQTVIRQRIIPAASNGLVSGLMWCHNITNALFAPSLITVEARCSQAPGYLWRSVCTFQEQIGYSNGKGMNILKYFWLRDSEEHFIPFYFTLMSWKCSKNWNYKSVQEILALLVGNTLDRESSWAGQDWRLETGDWASLRVSTSLTVARSWWPDVVVVESALEWQEDTSPQHLEVQYAGFLLLHTTTQHFNTAL